MLSTTSIILLGVIILIAIIVIVKWWKTPNNQVVHHKLEETKEIENEESVGPPDLNKSAQQPPPMVFAVNDQGNLDLTDMSGKILNIGYGPNPKTYINLLDQAEKDTDKKETEYGIIFRSNVGNTKLYEIGGRPYIINYTRL